MAAFVRPVGCLVPSHDIWLVELPLSRQLSSYRPLGSGICRCITETEITEMNMTTQLNYMITIKRRSWIGNEAFIGWELNIRTGGQV